jgi:hypothetical protein
VPYYTPKEVTSIGTISLPAVPAHENEGAARYKFAIVNSILHTCMLTI